MKFVYMYQPPRRYTFEQQKLKEWVEFYCKGKVLNLFAGIVKLNVNEIRNDVNPEMPAEHHMDATEFVKTWKGEKFDTVILDPPYNIRKGREKYGGRYIGLFTEIKNELLHILNPQSRIISLGYDSGGMSSKRGFQKIALCLVYHGGDHNDTIGVVEEMVQGIETKIEEIYHECTIDFKEEQSANLEGWFV